MRFADLGHAWRCFAAALTRSPACSARRSVGASGRREGRWSRDYSLVRAAPAPRTQDWDPTPRRRAPAASPATPTATPTTMHRSPAVVLGCVDCHGGNPGDHAAMPALAHDDPAYVAARDRAHVLPRYPKAPGTSRRAPIRSAATRCSTRKRPNTSASSIPSDYRVAREACGACHIEMIEAAERSLMATGRDAVGRRGLQ